MSMILYIFLAWSIDCEIILAKMFKLNILNDRQAKINRRLESDKVKSISR